MNWLLIAVILVIAWKMVAGYRKGFLRVAYSLVEWILVLVFVTWASPYVADFLTNHTGLPAYIEAQCIERMRDSVKTQSDQIDSTEVMVPIETKTAELGEKLKELGIVLPDKITEKLFATSQDKIDEAMSTTGEMTDRLLEEKGVYQAVAEKISGLAISGLSYILTLILSLIIFRAIGSGLHLVNKVPLVGGVNQVFGFLAGSIEGLICVWIFFAVTAACAGTGWGKFVITYIEENPMLIWLYQNNLLVSILLSFLLK